MNKYTHIFMIGIGGIGMSALARYFALNGKTVAGYDRTPSMITSQLLNEGIKITFDDKPVFEDSHFADPQKNLVIYTPAVKQDNGFMAWFSRNHFTMMKRAGVLGEISKAFRTIAVAGTHGKTSISCMAAHLLRHSAVGCNAILGGIPKNYKTNFLHDNKSAFLVTEADEFDKSFLKLHPNLVTITSADADHLDIYGSRKSLLESFEAFAGKINQEGVLLLKHHTGVATDNLKVKNIYSYALDDKAADVYADNVVATGETMQFDLITPQGSMNHLEMKAPGLINIENAVAASFMAMQAGVAEDEIREGLKTFEGVHRRLDKQFVSEQTVYIDDYAHHPEEINALLKSVRTLYPDSKLTGIFQPHLYSRTKDFADGFAHSLSQLDEVILLDIYPAREKPLEGVTSKLIFDKISSSNKTLLSKEELLDFLNNITPEILLTIGAGDIDRLVAPIREMLQNRLKQEDVT